jgi:hypothetical protein
MSAILTVSMIARTEARLIFRSWGFRIFAGMTLAALVLVMVTLTSPAYAGLYFSRALSGAFPLIVIKLLSVFQGLMAVIIGTDFLKRDRRQDTTEVIYAHPFANAQYILGKFLGIFAGFALLDIVVLAATAVVHVFFSRAPFAAGAYLAYIGLLTLPTLVFMIGLTIFLGSLIRSQAAVYLLTVSYAFLTLAVVGPRWNYILDVFGFHTPVLYSDFIGLGNGADLLMLRGAYLLLGVALTLGAAMLMKRLSQSPGVGRAAGITAVACAALAIVLAGTYLGGKAADRSFRAALKAESRDAAASPAMTMESCDLKITPRGSKLTATADLALINNGPAPLKTILLSLNPGLRVTECKSEAGALLFEQKHHLLKVEAREAIAPGGRIRVSVVYAGMIDERYCYLDIEDARLDPALRIWFVAIPKRYAAVSPEFIQLTPESGWYPRPGLPEALLFPAGIKRDYTKFSLSVNLPAGLTAVSQAIPEKSSSGGGTQFVFKPETPLPQLSLTAGRYEQKSVTVDGVRYGLFIRAGHDRFTPQLKDIAPEIPQLIKQIKDAYEVLLGLNYPFHQFSLVETPIQFTSYNRLWTMAQEQVQPQITFLPEMGVFCSGAELRAGGAAGGARAAGIGAGTGGAARTGGAGARGGAQAGPKDIQRALVNRFIQGNLTSSQAAAALGGLVAGLRATAPLGIQVDSNSESQFDIFPNFLAFTNHYDVAEWPLIGYATEAYIHERIGSQAGGLMRLAQGALGTNVQDEINKYLMDHSLEDALKPEGHRSLPITQILREKGKTLLILIRAKLGAEDFDEKFLKFLKDRRFLPIPRGALEEFAAGLGRVDLGATVASWFRDKGLPGFMFDDIQTYRVIDKEKTKFQVKFLVTNPTDMEGVIKVNLATQGGFGGARGGGGMGGGLGASASAPETRTILVPARTVKEVGILMERAPAMTTIDTAISRNLPGVFTLPFSNQPTKPGVKAFDGETSRPYVPAVPGADGEYVIDNEDPGFKLPPKGRENWLRSAVRGLFTSDTGEGDYVSAAGLLNPPDNWEPIVMQSFYGRFVRSAYVKKSGQGTNKVAWTVDLPAAGTYNIYFYYEGLGAAMGRGGAMRGMAGGGRAMAGQPGGQPGGGQGGGQGGGGNAPGGAQGARGPNAMRMQPGKKHFLVRHGSRTEEIVVDLKDIQTGWTLIGGFPLEAGENRIEMTDKNEERFVLADAVKWVVQK